MTSPVDQATDFIKNQMKPPTNNKHLLKKRLVPKNKIYHNPVGSIADSTQQLRHSQTSNSAVRKRASPNPMMRVNSQGFASNGSQEENKDPTELAMIEHYRNHKPESTVMKVTRNQHTQGVLFSML
jgi:hypothetical protein